jgi:hypothetical protein
MLVLIERRWSVFCFNISRVFVTVQPCSLHPRKFFIFDSVSSVGKRYSPAALCFDLSMVFCQGATMPALQPRKVEPFLDPSCEGDSYSHQGRPKWGAEKITPKKGPAKCAQGSVAHFEL